MLPRRVRSILGIGLQQQNPTSIKRKHMYLSTQPPQRFLLSFSVDLATIDPTSEETERTSTTMVTSLVEAYQSNVRASLNSSMDSRESVTSKAEEQWPVLAMFKNLENLPGPLRQFWILYRYGSETLRHKWRRRCPTC